MLRLFVVFSNVLSKFRYSFLVGTLKFITEIPMININMTFVYKVYLKKPNNSLKLYSTFMNFYNNQSTHVLMII